MFSVLVVVDLVFVVVGRWWAMVGFWICGFAISWGCCCVYLLAGVLSLVVCCLLLSCYVLSCLLIVLLFAFGLCIVVLLCCGLVRCYVCACFRVCGWLIFLLFAFYVLIWVECWCVDLGWLYGGLVLCFVGLFGVV